MGEAGLEITILDNGAGITDLHQRGDGKGYGLALHSTLLAVIGGELEMESELGSFTKIKIVLPVHRNPNNPIRFFIVDSQQLQSI
jgi:signal transduction histidine kinase